MARASKPFFIKDCDLIALATGVWAQNLRELRDRVTQVERQSLYFHFFGRLLRPSFDDPDYRNDFATWADRSLRDHRLAERLGMLDPLQYEDVEDLRGALIDTLEERLAEEEETFPWAKSGQEFYFSTAQVVVFDTGLVVATPMELAALLPRLSTGTIFYHFVEARRRVPAGKDDFTFWLEGLDRGHEELCGSLAQVDYYYGSLAQLREALTQVFQQWATRHSPVTKAPV
ncbi:MAG: DUF5752 family protein [Nitrospinota bacterium]